MHVSKVKGAESSSKHIERLEIALGPLRSLLRESN
jgi:hypothetical protein